MELFIEGAYQGWLQQMLMSEPSLGKIWYFYLPRWSSKLFSTFHELSCISESSKKRKPESDEAFSEKKSRREKSETQTSPTSSSQKRDKKSERKRVSTM